MQSSIIYSSQNIKNKIQSKDVNICKMFNVSTLGLLFQSDWSTSTGTSDAAQRDTNKTTPWTVINGTSSLLTVMSAAGLSFPATMTNVLQVKRPAGSTPSCWCHLDGLPLPAIGESRFYRVYVRVTYSNTDSTTGNNHHPIQSQALPTTFNWHWGNNTDGTFSLQHKWDPNLESWNPNSTSSTNIVAKNDTYRLEWTVYRVDTSFCRQAVRMYDSSDTLLYPDGAGNSLFRLAGGTTETVVNVGDAHHLLSDSPTAYVTSMGKFEVGDNGGIAFTNDEFHYFGGVMIRSDTWCGAY
jgi:hypothetical protein